MRRLLVILAAFGMMWAVRSLRLDGAVMGPDPLTLAAIGFVVLASFTVGELGGALKLPKITGYIVSGVVLGPQVVDILSAQVVGEMQTFNTLALGLIATTAGLELDLSAIRRVLRTLLTTVAAKVPLLVVVVGGAFYATESVLHILGLEQGGQLMALGLIFAVLGIGTSPAIALAIINESRAKGRLSDLVLAIAVVKDLVVVVCLAIAIAIARVLIAPDAPLGADVLVHVAEELGASIAVGAVVGGLLILYMRFVAAEMLLAVLAAILLTAEVSKVLHLELLLVFIAAGFVVRNFSKYEHELLHSLERIALPVFVVFFTTAGANVDLHGTLTLLPLAIVIAAARAVAFFLSAKLGAAVGKEAAPVADNAWMAYLPQAGVTLGLVFLAAEKLPELADPLSKTGMAMVALHLLVGPILLGIALRRAGEIPDGAQPDAPEAKPHEPEAPAEVAPRVAAPDPAPVPPRAAPSAAELAAKARHRELVAPLEQVRATLRTACEDFVGKVARPRNEEALGYARGVFAAPEEGESMALAIHRRLPKDRPELVADWVPEVLRLEQSVRAQVHRLPAVVVVPYEPEALAVDNADSMAVAARKLGLRVAKALGLRRGRERVVPLRLLGRLACEARVAEAAVALAGAWPRSYASMLGHVQRVVTEACGPEAALEDAEQDAARFVTYVERVLEEAAFEVLDELLRTTKAAGGPALPRGQLRFSKVEPVARAARHRVEREAEAWHRIADAAFDTVRARTAVRAFETTLEEVLDKRVQAPLQTAREQVLPVVEQVLGRLKSAEEALEGEGVELAWLERALGLAKSAYPKSDRTRVRRARARYRRAAQGHLLVSELTRVIDGVPGELTVLAPGTTLGLDDRVDAVSTVPLDFGRRAETVFLERLAPRLDEVLAPVSDIVVGSDLSIEETVQVAVYGIEAARQAHPEVDEEQVRLFRASLERAIREAEVLQTAFADALETAEQALAAEAHKANEELSAMLGADPGAGRRVRSQVRATRRAIRARVGAWGRDLAAALGQAARRFARGSSLVDAQAPDPRRDPAAVHAFIDGELALADGLELPPLYHKLFSAQPLEDLRLAVAHRDLLERTSRRVGLRSRGGARVLVVGGHGAGRTSFLNALELRHQRARVVRLDAFFHLRAEGVVSALAAELSCRDAQAAVLEALRERPTLVLIDDLERHVSADDRGARELERLVEIIVESHAQTAWVATTTPAALVALSRLTAFEQAFERRVTLPQLDAAALQAVVEARTRLGGVRVDLPQPGPLVRLRGGEDAAQAVFYGRLHAASRGNLRAALQIFLRCLRPGEGEVLTVARAEPIRLPTLQRTSAHGLAILGLMLRFGPHDVPELARALRLPESKARLHALHLLDTGLLHHPGGSSQELLYVPPEIEPAVSAALRRLGLLGKEEA